ncbi:MAG: beta galactosidase jelly roll domain-containing protein [Prolixibacteraceae bacterium]|nr:beta galactosidase jelly roll domain-containing protein [Prolixibacteraceae bacterium]MBN2774621.1 beta galactosidase jelly roll domain-containing protein [Prolixibacteraceae bacterium]
MKSLIFKIIIISIFTLIAFPVLGSEYNKKLVKEVNLNGTWKFTIMHSNDWYEVNYDDSDWDRIEAPGDWERQGYNGYNGYGFYRKKVNINEDLNEFQMYLMLGYIDDVDEVYFNGELIGSTGSFPPQYNSAYNANRSYFIPQSVIRPGQENIIAVKVFDMGGEGGIVKGDLGIYTQEFPVKTEIDLVGLWKFTTRNNESFREADYDDSDWNEILVPGYWENQGYRNYDGSAWYRKEFTVKNTDFEDYMVLLLGKIDDIDMVFLNGTWIGQTGENEMFRFGDGISDSYCRSDRSYVFPSDLLKNGTNVIAIKVYDKYGEGGIYEGLVGIVNQSKFVDYWKKKSQKYR